MPASELPTANRSATTSVGYLYSGFVATGMVTTLLGPVLPFLTARWQLDDMHAGLLFTAQFAGSMAGVLLSSVILTRRGFRPSLVAGFGLMGIGVAALGFVTWIVGLISVTLFGLGLGLTIPTTNLLVAESSAHRRAAALNTLNLAWCVGAVCFPFIATWFVKIHKLPAMILLLGGGVFVFSLIFASPLATIAERRDTPRTDATPKGPRVQARVLAILGLLFFLYVGTEGAVSGWVATFGRRIHSGAGIGWVAVPSFFWGGLLLGRALAPLLLRRVREIPLARAGLVLATLGTCVVLISTNLPALTAGVGLAGLGLSAVFPITIAELSRRFEGSASRFVGAMFALGGLGGATLPWLVGYVSNKFGNLRAGLWVPVAGCVILLALYLLRWDKDACEVATQLDSH
ncbi:MAG TPA: MFS transporter [Candidatus Acidoferrales bacterium]|nr:MFS transporter [Candidatus Acidoferrales bacterium]